MTPGKGSKYREFYDLSGRITCMSRFSLVSENEILSFYLFSVATKPDLCLICV